MAEACKHGETHTDQPFAFAQDWYVICSLCDKIISEGFPTQAVAEECESDHHSVHRFNIRWRTQGSASNGGVGEYTVSIPQYGGGTVVPLKHHQFIVRSLLKIIEGAPYPINKDAKERIIHRAVSSIETDKDVIL